MMKSKKILLAIFITLLLPLRLFASSDYAEKILNAYENYSSSLRKIPPYESWLSENNSETENVDFYYTNNEGGWNQLSDEEEIRKNLLELKKVIEEYMNSSLFNYEKINNSELFNVIQSVNEECAVSLENLDKPKIILKEYLLIQRQMIRMNHENQINMNKSLILFVYVFFGLVIAMIALIIFGIKYSALQNARKQQNQIFKTMIQVQEKERERISHDLHDTVVQDIRSILFFSKRIQENLNSIDSSGKGFHEEDKNSDLNDLIEKVILIENKNLIEIRNVIKNLTPPELNKSDFRTIVSDYCFGFSKNTKLMNPEAGIECKFYVQSEAPLQKLTAGQKINLFRIIQESLNNIQKYSKADECSVFFSYNDSILKLIISDDGVGFNDKDSSKVNSDGTHLGIMGMKSRAKLIGADFKIRSSEIGTEVIVSIPI